MKNEKIDEFDENLRIFAFSHETWCRMVCERRKHPFVLSDLNFYPPIGIIDDPTRYIVKIKNFQKSIF